ncbi:hypothetical protein LR948_08525 [Roseivivax sp. GX 12232]|uniref:hypothetical protein n=1 Tax=Roseivivax sp. GX 12232 TaxID=2900547 RepID=UPI001E568A9B|nr:hypothetical protein [Roseivivax sp. GX 12232]MCE0505393.1 hypothetical protein [Roseivivax sp. GX 12232]
MKSALRAMSEESRNRFTFWLGLVGQKNDDGWIKYVVPLVNEDWPRERQFRTSGSVKAWIRLLDDTGDDFPAVYEAVKKFLVPIETDDYSFYRFTRKVNEGEPITTRFPIETLDLIHRVTPNGLSRLPYELPKILALISEVEPSLTSDYRYLRLIDLLEHC